VSKPLGVAWWTLSSPHTYLATLRTSGIGVYAVANWNEAGTKHGAFHTYRNLRSQTRLLVGPAGHCGWSQVRTETGFDIVDEEKRFFDYWLKGVNNGVMDERRVSNYTYNAARGQEWRRAATWRCHRRTGRRGISVTGPWAPGTLPPDATPSASRESPRRPRPRPRPDRVRRPVAQS
jgi:X-Pro dipeptidyl-peptidase (S15 family)